MIKTNNNLILNTLGVIAISVFSIMFVMPTHANAGFYSVSSGMMGVNNNPNPSPTPAPVTNPVPAIYSISPDSATLNSNAATITITGENFVAGSSARWNSESRATSFVSSNKLTMTLTTADMSVLGAYSITVFNSLPGGGMSNAALFHVNKAIVVAEKVKTAAVVKKIASTTTKNTSLKASAFELSANALFGSDGLMPSSLLGWIIFLTLILLLVILARKAFAEKKPDAHHPAAHA